VPVRETVALVLAGGGARGAYEVGALSVLIPALEREGRRPQLLVGTSVGALNVAFLAAMADRPADEVIAEGELIWSEIRYGQVLSGLGSLRGLKRLGTYLGGVVGLPLRATGILDPAPLEKTIEELVPFGRLERNVADGIIHAAVVATSAASSRSVVFHTSGSSPEYDDRRGIEYVRTGLEPEHVRASAAIPVLFPAVRVERPAGARDWYFDGGTRLNTPIKPALTLEADRVVVVGLNSIAGRPEPRGDHQPDIFEGVSQILHAVLVDPLVNDVRTLAGVNAMVADAAEAGAEIRGRRAVPYVFVAPRTVDAIGEIAVEVYREYYAGAAGFKRSPDLALLGRLVGGGRDAVHGELLSYLFFAPEFARELLALGRRDAERWLSERHDDGLWRVGSAPPE
jgi:NTE family protein